MIRWAVPGDVPAIHDLIVELAEFENEPEAVESTPEDLVAALFGDQPALFCHVAESDDGEVVGFALWFVNYSTWLGKHGIYLEDLCVRSDFRGRGIGGALLAQLARICIDRGYRRLEWWVMDAPSMRPSWKFYESQGARALRDWVPHRISGDALAALAAKAPY